MSEAFQTWRSEKLAPLGRVPICPECPYASGRMLCARCLCWLCIDHFYAHVKRLGCDRVRSVRTVAGDVIGLSQRKPGRMT